MISSDPAMIDPSSEKLAFTYGSHRPAHVGEPSGDGSERRFLAFDVDLGGFNNILMQFEIMVVLASLTGRTLVLPPATPFYLLGHSNSGRGIIQRSC